LRLPAARRLLLFGAACGALYCVAFPPYSLRPLGWFALVPLLLAVGTATRKRQAWNAGWIAGMVVCLGGYFWIADTAHRFWKVPWVFAVFLLAVYGSFAELHFAVFALLAWLLRRRIASHPAAWTATLFVLCEMLVPRIFPDKLGHTTLDIGALPFAVAIAGVHGVSFALAWMAACVAALCVRDAPHRRARWAELGLAIALLGAGWIWGTHHRQALAGEAAPRQLDVLVVQANIGDPEELADALGSVTEAIDSTVATYVALTLGAIDDRPPDLVVWPETAVPSVPRPRVLAQLQLVSRAANAPVLFGAYDAERIANNRLKLYNAAFLMMPSGELRARYYKHKLLLFGEYVPLSDRFPQLLDILPTPGEFTPGPGPAVFPVGDLALAPLICYELLFPGVVRGALRVGGGVIVNLTNDYWFGKHLEPYQHLALSRMCAMEVATPIVRATNTGISALIDASGRVIERGGLWTQETLRGNLPLVRAGQTPFARWGTAATAFVVLGSTIAASLLWLLCSRRPRAADLGSEGGLGE